MTPYDFAKEEFRKNITEIKGKQHNPRIVWYHSFTTYKATNDETPWCSSFVCAMCFLAGVESTRSAAAKSWLTFGEPGTGKKGELAIFVRNGGHHVTFVEKDYNPKEKVVNCLGGNQDNRVSIKNYNDANLLGFRKIPV